MTNEERREIDFRDITFLGFIAVVLAFVVVLIFAEAHHQKRLEVEKRKACPTCARKGY